MRSVESVRAVAGRGLEGDRYFHAAQEEGDPSLEITLIELESIEGVAADHGLAVEPVEMRRNIVTSGVKLRDLLGKQFSVGEVRLEGLADNPPCKRLERLTGKPVLKPFIEKGGIRARIVRTGTIKPGDEVSSS